MAVFGLFGPFATRALNPTRTVATAGEGATLSASEGSKQWNPPPTHLEPSAVLHVLQQQSPPSHPHSSELRFFAKKSHTPLPRLLPTATKTSHSRRVGECR